MNKQMHGAMIKSFLHLNGTKTMPARIKIEQGMKLAQEEA